MLSYKRRFSATGFVGKEPPRSSRHDRTAASPPKEAARITAATPTAPTTTRHRARSRRPLRVRIPHASSSCLPSPRPQWLKRFIPRHGSKEEGRHVAMTALLSKSITPSHALRYRRPYGKVTGSPSLERLAARKMRPSTS